MNELYSKINENLKQEIVKIDQKILNKDSQDIKNLEIKISEKQAEIEKELENEAFKDSKEKEEIQKWLYLSLESEQLSILLNVLFSPFDDLKK